MKVVVLGSGSKGNSTYIETKETKVLDSTIFMSLNNSAKEWADEILKEMSTLAYNANTALESGVTNSKDTNFTQLM